MMEALLGAVIAWVVVLIYDRYFPVNSELRLPIPDPLIWWLSQNDFDDLGDPPESLPKHLLAQLLSADGRNGRGRLWAPPDFPNVEVKPWPNTPLAQHCDRCAGIVITSDVIPALKTLPGIITTTPTHSRPVMTP